VALPWRWHGKHLRYGASGAVAQIDVCVFLIIDDAYRAAVF